jgi:hypothetical protein
MTKAKISEYSSTAADNTDIGGINIGEGMAPSDVNNAMREQMSQLKEFLDGSSGDTITTAKIVATTATILSGASVTGTATFNSAVIMGGATNLQDNDLQRPTLLDYCVKGSALGSVGTLATVDMTAANFFSATLGSATTFAFTNPCTSGNFGGFVLELTNGGAFTVTYPASVDFVGGVAPTLTAAGVDQLVFTTRDAGTTYLGFVAGLDIKTPA